MKKTLTVCNRGGGGFDSGRMRRLVKPLRQHGRDGNHAPPPTKALFIAQLNSLCGKADSAFSAAHNASGQEAVVSHYVALFASLKAPPALKSLYPQYVRCCRRNWSISRTATARPLQARPRPGQAAGEEDRRRGLRHVVVDGAA